MAAERRKPRLTRVTEVGPDGSRRQKTVRLEDVTGAQPVPGRRELGEGEKAKARELWNRAGRYVMGSMTPEQWVDLFTKDLHPETELLNWETYADVTDELWTAGVGQNRETLLAAVVRVGTGEIDVPANAPGITDEVVGRIRSTMDECRKYKLRKPLEGLPESVTRVGCPVFPLAALAEAMSGDWQSREEPLVNGVRDDADVIMAVSRDGKGSVFYGRERLEQIVASGIAEPVARVAFLIDGTDVSDDVEMLAAMVTVLKGHHEHEGG